MSEEKSESDLSMWFSTYGLLTATRVLEYFNIKLDNDELLVAMKDPFNVYHRLLIIPLRNVFNGIILQQAHDYEVYAQKIFIDYLLSGESGKPEDSPGGSTREELEQERIRLTEMAEAFSDQELAHQQLIAASQAALIKVARELDKSLKIVVKKIARILQEQNINKEAALIEKAIRISMIYYSHDQELTNTSEFWVKLAETLDVKIDEKLQQTMLEAVSDLNEPIKKIEEVIPGFLEKADDLGISIRSYRGQFYDMILRVTESLNLLTDYHIDLEKLEENQSSLHFDSHIGDE